MNDKKLDRTFEKKVKHVQKHNGIHVFWDKEGVWKRIQQALTENGSAPKMIAWYAAMAASVSLLVASTVNYLNYDLNFDLPETNVEEVATPALSVESRPMRVAYSAMAADTMIIPIKSRTASFVSDQLEIKTIERIAVDYPKVDLVKNAQSRLSHEPTSGALKARIAGGMSVNSQFITPKVDIGVMFRISPKSSPVQRKVFLGGSVQFMKGINGEQLNTSPVSTGYFVKSSFTTEKYRNGKLRSWSTGAEYLIHSSDDSISDNMLRLFYNRNVMGRLKVGPEIMFSRSFRKVYPGITLALG